MMPRAAATAKRGAHVACTVAALHDGMPVAVRSAGGTSAAPTTYDIVYLAPAVVMRGTSGRRAGGGGVGAEGVICRMVTRSIRAVHCASSRALGRARDPTPTLCRRRSFSRTASGSATCAAQGLGGHAFRSSQPVRWDSFLVQRALRRTKGAAWFASRFSKGPR